MRSCSFITATLKGALPAIARARRRVNPSSSAAGTTWLTMPWRSARAASTGSAVNTISFTSRSGAAFRKGQHPADVVRHPELGRGHGEGGALGGDHEVAGQHGLGGAAPDAALNHRDHRPGVGLDLAHEPAQRVVPAERVAASLGQLVDV